MDARVIKTLLLASTLLMGCQRSVTIAQAEAALAPWERLLVRSASPATRSVELTLYTDSWALVTDARPVDLTAGEQVVRFPEVAAQTDGTGGYVQVPGTVTARRFRNDLQSRDRLLARYHGRQVDIYPRGATTPIQATLLMTDSGAVYMVGDRLYTEPPGRVALPPIEGLALSPTMEWIVRLDAPYSGIATVSYVANQLGWKTEYTLVTDRDQTRGDWKQWAAIQNRSGADYPDARITLVAGDVRRDREARPYAFAYGGSRAYADVAAPESYAARYLYRLPAPVTLRRDTDERVALRSFQGVPIDRTYRVEAAIQLLREPYPETPRKARIRLTIPNTVQAGLGEALPGGKITVYTPTRQGELAIAGEPTLADTPVGQSLEIDLGEAFDVTAERSQTAYRVTATTHEVAYRVLLRNQQGVAVNVWVTEQLSGDWTITRSSHPYERLSTTQIRFRVPVPAQGSTEVTYEASIVREQQR